MTQILAKFTGDHMAKALGVPNINLKGGQLNVTSTNLQYE